MSLYKVYGIVAGGVSIIMGAVLLISKRLDSNLSDKETSPDQIKPKRILWGILFIVGGLCRSRQFFLDGLRFEDISYLRHEKCIEYQKKQTHNTPLEPSRQG